MAQAAIRSPLADIDARTNTQAASAPTSTALKTGRPVTGQYLYEKFIAEAPNVEVTRQNLVKNMARNVDTQSFKAALKEMIEIAAQASEAKKQVARVRASELKNLYGMFRHFDEQSLAEAGYPVDGRVSYHESVTIARKILADAKLKWDGTLKVSDEEKERKRLQKLEQQTLEKIQISNPRQQNESMQEWLIRCGEILAVEIEHAQAADKEKALTKQAIKILSQYADKDGQLDITAVTALIDRMQYIVNKVQESSPANWTEVLEEKQ